MNSEDKGAENKSRFATIVSIGKELVSLLRDAALVLLAVLLIVFPAKLNVLLTDAGFEEGSVVGFKWKAKLVKSDDALKQAQATISDLQTRNDELGSALKYAQLQISDPTFSERVDKLGAENSEQRESVKYIQKSVSKTINDNAPLIEKARPASDAKNLSGGSRVAVYTQIGFDKDRGQYKSIKNSLASSRFIAMAPEVMNSKIPRSEIRYCNPNNAEDALALKSLLELKGFNKFATQNIAKCDLEANLNILELWVESS
jgi:hypothetical protein